MADQKVPLDAPPAYTDNPQPATNASAPPRQGVPVPPRPLDLPALSMIRGRRVILASASPRRRQLLAQIGLTQLEIIPSTLPEDKDKSLAPFEYVLQTAEQKARNVYQQEIDSTKGEPALVLAADTVVCTHMGQILEKPRNEKEHFATLKMLRDQNNGWHKVYTGVVCMAPLESLMDPGYAIETHVEETHVKFDQDVTDDLMKSYVKTREGADKAGGYGIQGLGSILVEKIDGTFDNVVGLPLRATLQLIEKVVVEPGVPEEVDQAI
ncbi:dTTP/UTP pyrophosphatase [Fulvia fulva]|uniref:dTTP/UTP pyrophosphatase n=1 Tax=Passalora fulva TaxID=5499 RepID=A0A9Q8PHG1_PASFU|nr:dTTP/UTP pyrophosphatase [Fulvia fulva]KAK4626126.1 dTTP/UTP pyrophosphatase [Fulvia fulva]KAK4627513.1 dTTP/UTP pyrophosphatase [Fulvia fulva]UJO22492.1 dTTP/UTP pyrophosphatase [Fulvia fulva]WPV14170.1 dTTP/UTP pyrophosphatase [Fulvia fulva]WPV29320.1 dTTP/UTP pyrophosphatase [Fulvia fulva]